MLRAFKSFSPKRCASNFDLAVQNLIWLEMHPHHFFDAEEPLLDLSYNDWIINKIQDESLPRMYRETK